MKKMMYFAAALLVLVGCNKKDNSIENTPKEVVTIKGSIVLPQTPNKIAPAEEWQLATTPFDMLWEEGDQIYIYNQGDPDHGQVFTLIEGVGTTEGTFSGTKLEDMSNYYVANVGQTGVSEYTVEYIEDNFSTPYILGTGNKDGFIIDNFGAVLGLPLKGEETLSKIEVKTFKGKDQPLSTFTMSFADGLELNNTTATMVYFPVDASELITIETINFYVDEELIMSKTLSYEKENLPGCNKVTTFPELGIPTYVDLGLSVRWATFNLGATKEEEFGDYYAWGETETYYTGLNADLSPKGWKTGKTNGYAWQSYIGFESEWKLTEWNPAPYGADHILKPEYDAAIANWGGDWRMPTKAEYEELTNNCTYEVKKNYNGTGVDGYVFTSKKSGFEGNFIFLPAAGEYSGLEYENYDDPFGYYLTSSVEVDEYDSSTADAYSLGVFAPDPEYDDPGWYFSGDYRYRGRTIRPVCPKY